MNLSMLEGWKTHIFALLIAGLAAWQSVEAGTFDVAHATQMLEGFALSALRAGVAKAGLK